MTLEQLLISKFQTLSPHRKQELLDFAEFLAQKSDSQSQGKLSNNKTTIRGLWKDVVVTDEDLDKAKKAVFKNISEWD